MNADYFDLIDWIYFIVLHVGWVALAFQRPKIEQRCFVKPHGESASTGDEIYVTGRVINRAEHNGKGVAVWEIQGVFTDPESAVAACIDHTWFVGPLNLNEPLPLETIDWKGLVFPIAEKL